MTHSSMTHRIAFVERLGKLLNIGDRFARTQISGDNSVFVNFINLPQEVVAYREGGGAEAENNRALFNVSGFRSGDDKIKIETLISVFPRSLRLRGKTGSSEAIAKYLAAHLNKIAKEIPPNFTHTKR
jgi:hypothetical protein